MESMINEKISQQDQKLIDKIISSSSVNEVIPASFIQEMVMFSSQRRGGEVGLNFPPPPPPPISPPSEAQSLVVSEVISKRGVSIPKIPLPLPENYQLSTTFLPSHPPSPLPSLQERAKGSVSTVWSINSANEDKENRITKNKTKNIKEGEEEHGQTKNLFTKKDLQLLESVVVKLSKQNENDILRIICRTGRFKENGFPCHNCLEILLLFDDNDYEENLTFSHESGGGRCEECLKFKTREEWDSISWQRLEWYTKTPDGKIAANVFKSLVSTNVTSPSFKNNLNGKEEEGRERERIGFIEKIASETVEKIVSKLVDLIAKDLTSKKISQIVSQRISERLQNFEIDLNSFLKNV
jgi:hypothetical protein